MFKVLITDDEPTIREGLRTLIDWESLGFTVVDTAANGNDALRKIDIYRPELLIVDIRMPGMTGLELIELVRQKNEEVLVLILSGYADFDYAKKAMGLNTEGYLLKPVDEDELIAHLAKLNAVLTREQQKKMEHGSRQDWDREKLVRSVLSSEGGQRIAAITSTELEAAGMQWDSYSVVLIQLHGREHGIEPGYVSVIRDRIAAAFGAKNRAVVFMLDTAIGLLLKDKLQSEGMVKRLYDEIAALIPDQQLDIAAACGSAVSSFGDIRRSFEEAALLLSRSFFYDGGQLIMAATAQLYHGSEACFRFRGSAVPDSNELAAKLYFAIDVGNTDTVKQLVTGIGPKLLRSGVSEEHKIHLRGNRNGRDGQDAAGQRRVQVRESAIRRDTCDLYPKSL